MRIAMPVLENKGENSPISEHFGHAPFFAFIDLHDDGQYDWNIMVNPLENHGPGDIPRFMAEQDVQILVARGIGGRAIDFFNRLNIRVIRGASGSVKEIMSALLKEELQDKEYSVKDKHHHHEGGGCND